MRLVSHLDASKMSSWIGFCLYVASGVILQDVRKDKPNPQSASNLEFMVAAMKAVGKKHVIAKHFAAQLELEIGTQGIDRLDFANALYKLHNTASSAVDDDEFSLLRTRLTSVKLQSHPSQRLLTLHNKRKLKPYHNQHRLLFAGSTYPTAAPHQQLDSGSETIDTDFSWPPTGNTPSSDSSSSNTAYPFRTTKAPYVTDSNGNWIFDPNATRFTMDPLALNVTDRDVDNNLQDNELLNNLLNSAPWDTTFHIARGSRHPSG
ncbi:hypothetical protein EYC84_011942 [Monilinia fructicola]|uniref:Uncharacterized protein n=1 Tax=Monilinia fructicola TaxID=38448 RepID=A0A5M9J461_MONFR|nr:hypothetical protein EYC84_011942 [Monilinia fructicola]